MEEKQNHGGGVESAVEEVSQQAVHVPRGEGSSQREQQAQKPWGGTIPGLFKEWQDQSGWSRVSEGEGVTGKSK